MKALFLVLLLANVVLAGYAWYASSQVNPDAGILNRQMNADRIRITAARPMVPGARPAGACLEWGSFGAGELNAARAAVAALQLGSRVAEREVQVLAGYWVYIPPLASKADADKQIAELRKLGIEEYYMVDAQGAMRNAISLGIFKSADAANKYLETLGQKGLHAARVGTREHRVTQTAFQLRDPDVALTAKLAEVRLQFPGSELKATECPP